jgi:hypothetical protein
MIRSVIYQIGSRTNLNYGIEKNYWVCYPIFGKKETSGKEIKYALLNSIRKKEPFIQTI